MGKDHNCIEIRFILNGATKRMRQVFEARGSRCPIEEQSPYLFIDARKTTQ